MGLWAGIKRALNSTLGTTEFEPLDKIILGSKALKASDNFYSNILSGRFSGNSENPFIRENLITMNWQGSFKLKIMAYGRDNYNYVIIRINGVERYRLVLRGSSDVIYEEYTTDIITFKKDDIIGLEITSSGTSYGMNVESIDMYADVTDLSAFVINY